MRNHWDGPSREPTHRLRAWLPQSKRRADAAPTRVGCTRPPFAPKSRVKVGSARLGLALAGSDLSVKLGSLPSAGGTACLDFSKGARAPPASGHRPTPCLHFPWRAHFPHGQSIDFSNAAARPASSNAAPGPHRSQPLTPFPRTNPLQPAPRATARPSSAARAAAMPCLSPKRTPSRRGGVRSPAASAWVSGGATRGAPDPRMPPGRSARWEGWPVHGSNGRKAWPPQCSRTPNPGPQTAAPASPAPCPLESARRPARATLPRGSAARRSPRTTALPAASAPAGAACAQVMTVPRSCLHEPCTRLRLNPSNRQAPATPKSDPLQNRHPQTCALASRASRGSVRRPPARATLPRGSAARGRPWPTGRRASRAPARAACAQVGVDDCAALAPAWALSGAAFNAFD
jgi:hypothetical protein